LWFLTFLLTHAPPLQVPNIRFNVAKELEAIAPVCGLSVYESQISPVLNLLMDDTDRDVRFFAEKTSQTLEAEFAKAAT
jgi:hypothetical protein